MIVLDGEAINDVVDQPAVELVPVVKTPSAVPRNSPAKQTDPQFTGVLIERQS